MSDRPYYRYSIHELEEKFHSNLHRRPVLAQLHAELLNRTTHRAIQLRREIEGVLGGEIPIPPTPRFRVDRQSNQRSFL